MPKGASHPRVAPARAIAAAVAAVVLAAIALAAFLVNLAQTVRLPVAPLSGMIGPVRVSELRYLQVRSRGAVSPALAARMRQAAAGDPLAYEPFLFSAIASHVQGLGGEPQGRLLREAVRRNPRSRSARYLMLRHAVATGRLGEAMTQIAMLDRLNAPETHALLTAVGKQVATPRQVDEAVAALSPYPKLFAPFISGFVASPKPASLVRRLASQLPARGVDRATIAPQLSTSLLQAGDYAGAREVWRAMGGKAAEGLVTDATFVDAAAQPPFGWELAQSTVGVAERQPGGGVLIDYFGRKPGMLLRQLVTLPAGAYVAEFAYDPQSERTGAIDFQLSCMGTENVLAQKTLDARPGGTVKAQVRFVVPFGNCPGQSLEWIGTLQERRTSQQVLIRRVAIRPESGRS